MEAFKDTVFRHSFWYTALFAVVSLVVINVLAFALALALTQKMRGHQYFPYHLFHAQSYRRYCSRYIWQLIFNGILSHFNTALGLNEWYGFWGLIILVSWQQIGYMMIIYIAGLQSIPGDMMEAAQIDGASGFQRLFRVTIPMDDAVHHDCMFLSITNGFKLFDQNLSLTAGEPSKMSEMLALNIFNTFYGRTGLGRRWTGKGSDILYYRRWHWPDPAAGDALKGGAAVNEEETLAEHGGNRGIYHIGINLYRPHPYCAYELL